MPVELRPVTIENWDTLTELKIREDQRGFVASNVYSIAEAQFGFEFEGHWDSSSFGVYSDGEPVGFLMYCLNFSHPRFQAFILRLMVGEPFQGKGHGRDAMVRVLDTFRADERIRQVCICYKPHNRVAQALYASLGFVEPGELIGGETLAILKLR